MPRNTIIYTTLTSFNGDMLNGDGGDAMADLANIAALIAAEDTAHSHVLQVTRIEFGDDGRATCSDATGECAEMVAALYDSPKVMTTEDDFVSPIVTDWTDWTPAIADPYQRSDRAEHGLSYAQVAS